MVIILIRNVSKDMFGRKPAVEKHMNLIGQKIFLHPWRKSDAKEWVELRAKSREFIQPFEPLWADDMPSIAAFERRRLRYQAESIHDIGYGFLIQHRYYHRLLGGLSINHVRRGALQIGTLSYWMGQEYTRQGYMSEGLGLAIHFAFGYLDLHRLEAYCLPHNDASIALLRKFNFTEEGLAIQYLRIAGDWQDHIRFTLINQSR